MLQLQTVGEIVRLLRGRRDLEQVELARACGWRDASAVSRIETDRIHPTRKTLVKLAENLANPARGQTSDDVLAWLYLAAGILPTPEDMSRVKAEIPVIERWSHAAVVLDFGWNIWGVNRAFTGWLPIPEGSEGRNMLSVMFGAQVRAQLGARWEMFAREAIIQFRGETDHRAEQRWRRALIADLSHDADFARLWDDVVPADVHDLQHRHRRAIDRGEFSVLRVPLWSEPRLTLVHIIRSEGLSSTTPSTDQSTTRN